MDPYQNQRDDRNQQNPGRTTTPGTPVTSGGDQTPVDPGREDPEARNTPANNREPQYSVGFTMIPPNESRRSKTQMMAQKELEELQKWREENKPKPVQPVSEKLGGNATLAAVREKQHLELHHAKLQKKLKQQEADKKKRQEEDEENQRMKDKQRERFNEYTVKGERDHTQTETEGDCPVVVGTEVSGVLSDKPQRSGTLCFERRWKKQRFSQMQKHIQSQSFAETQLNVLRLEEV
ncbi:hypothetical protein KUCAC02_027799, partial [Chaenocephalus aceratus]